MSDNNEIFRQLTIKERKYKKIIDNNGEKEYNKDNKTNDEYFLYN